MLLAPQSSFCFYLKHLCQVRALVVVNVLAVQLLVGRGVLDGWTGQVKYLKQHLQAAKLRGSETLWANELGTSRELETFWDCTFLTHFPSTLEYWISARDPLNVERM